MSAIDVTQARDQFADIINRASYARERTAIRRRGKVVAAIVSADDLELLEKLSTLVDVQDVKRALDEAFSKGEKPIPWEQAKERLGL